MGLLFSGPVRIVDDYVGHRKRLKTLPKGVEKLRTDTVLTMILGRLTSGLEVVVPIAESGIDCVIGVRTSGSSSCSTAAGGAVGIEKSPVAHCSNLFTSNP